MAQKWICTPVLSSKLALFPTTGMAWGTKLSCLSGMQCHALVYLWGTPQRLCSVNLWTSLKPPTLATRPCWEYKETNKKTFQFLYNTDEKWCACSWCPCMSKPFLDRVVNTFLSNEVPKLRNGTLLVVVGQHLFNVGLIPCMPSKLWTLLIASGTFL